MNRVEVIELLTPRRIAITTRDHRRVLAAISAGDVDAASAALSDHLTHIMDLVAQLTPDDP